MISALGGIGASVKIAMGSIAGIMLFKFSVDLAGLVRRQNQLRYCKIVISIY